MSLGNGKLETAGPVGKVGTVEEWVGVKLDVGAVEEGWVGLVLI